MKVWLIVTLIQETNVRYIILNTLNCKHKIDWGRRKYYDTIFITYINVFRFNIWNILVKASCKYRYLIGYIGWRENVKLRVSRRVCLRMSRVIRASFRWEGAPAARRVPRIRGTPAHELEGGEQERWNAGRYATYYPPISVMSFAWAKWLRTSKGGIFPDGKAHPSPARKGGVQGEPVRAVPT